MDNFPMKQLEKSRQLQNYVVKALENHGRRENRWTTAPEKQGSVQCEAHNC